MKNVISSFFYLLVTKNCYCLSSRCILCINKYFQNGNRFKMKNILLGNLEFANIYISWSSVPPICYVLRNLKSREHNDSQESTNKYHELYLHKPNASAGIWDIELAILMMMARHFFFTRWYYWRSKCNSFARTDKVNNCTLMEFKGKITNTSLKVS